MSTPATNRQIPDQSILDAFYKQTYLGNAYIVPTTVDLSTTDETIVLMIENPAVDGAPNLTSKALFVNLRRYTSTLEPVIVNTYFNPTVLTTGTAFTPINLRPASTNASVAKCYQEGQVTVSANGTKISSIGVGSDDFVVQDNQLLIILDPGQSLLITATAAAENTSLSADISFYDL
jgi:hypothetical protein